MPIRERVSGPDHPDTLTIRGNLARLDRGSRGPACARDQFAACCAIRERVLGPDHPYTLTIRANLARWTGVAGGTRPAPATSTLPCCPSASGSQAPTTHTP